MIIPPHHSHPKGEPSLAPATLSLQPASVDTYGGKIHIEWAPDSPVTPMGQLPFFIQFLKISSRFDDWVNSCPLTYASNNAPSKTDVLGSLLLSILSGHKRYAHIATLTNDNVNPPLLGMKKVISDDSARRAIKKIDPESGVAWLQNNVFDCCEPLFNTPWILDIDTTVKPLFGHQESAEVGYNPQKPGRPSHTYHTYMMANLRLILDVEVKAGNQSHSNYSLPELMQLLQKMPTEHRPAFVRGDIGFGTDNVMRDLESIGQSYLFKLKKTQNVLKLLHRHHALGRWKKIHKGWEGKEDHLQLQGWEAPRRVIIFRRQLKPSTIVGIEKAQQDYQQLSFIDEPEDIKLFEYSVLVTDREDELVTVFQLYRDRADCENNFDELKNQWGWSGFTTRDVASCRLMSRIIALIYNWWTLYVRLAIPDLHHEAITSRPLLLSSIGRLTTRSSKRIITLTSLHGHTHKLALAYQRLGMIFGELKAIAPQLKPKEAWRYLLGIIAAFFNPKTTQKIPPDIVALLT